MVGEARADAVEQLGRGRYQCIDGDALFVGGVVDCIEQRLHGGQQAAAFFQRGGIADQAVGEFAA
ncbi:hypothetical protein D3C71_1291720 [compost metagenome]